MGKFLSPTEGQEATWTNNILTRTAVAATIGGTVSRLGGGKFANGAYTAAFMHLVNSENVVRRTFNIVKSWREKITTGGTPVRDIRELVRIVKERGVKMDELNLIAHGSGQGGAVNLNPSAGNGEVLIDLTHADPRFKASGMPTEAYDLMIELSKHMRPGGKLNLYVCNIGAGKQGAQLKLNLEKHFGRGNVFMPKYKVAISMGHILNDGATPLPKLLKPFGQ